MVSLLLAPFNVSMRLGQGYNSFLQLPCIEGAVEILQDSLKTQAARDDTAGNASQVVSYSSRLVGKISEVVRSMNISAASSIKSGTIETWGNSLSVDGAKFAASDLNAVVSVKVINRESIFDLAGRFQQPLTTTDHRDDIGSSRTQVVSQQRCRCPDAHHSTKTERPFSNPMNNVKMDSEKFFDYYGDCYISDMYPFSNDCQDKGHQS